MGTPTIARADGLTIVAGRLTASLRGMREGWIAVASPTTC